MVRWHFPLFLDFLTITLIPRAELVSDFICSQIPRQAA